MTEPGRTRAAVQLGLDPAAEADVAAAPSWKPPADLAAARRGYDAAAVTAGGPLVDVAVRDDLVAGVPVRRYGANANGTIVYAAGGGWVFGHPGSHDAYTRALAAATGYEVVSVGFRRSPEAQMPAAIDDVTAVVRAMVGRVVVAGDSGGGLLAAEASLRAPVAAVVLLYPALDPDLRSARYDAGLPPGRDQMRWFWEQYAGDARASADVSPLYRDLPAAMPPHLILEASHDPLLDEGRAYAAKLSDVQVKTYDGQIHGFARQLARFPLAMQTVNDIAAFLRARLAPL
jgi:acetyl esterase